MKYIKQGHVTNLTVSREKRRNVFIYARNHSDFF